MQLLGVFCGFLFVPSWILVTMLWSLAYAYMYLKKGYFKKGPEVSPNPAADHA